MIVKKLQIPLLLLQLILHACKEEIPFTFQDKKNNRNENKLKTCFHFYYFFKKDQILKKNQNSLLTFAGNI